MVLIKSYNHFVLLTKLHKKIEKPVLQVRKIKRIIKTKRKKNLNHHSIHHRFFSPSAKAGAINNKPHSGLPSFPPIHPHNHQTPPEPDFRV